MTQNAPGFNSSNPDPRWLAGEEPKPEQIKRLRAKDRTVPTDTRWLIKGVIRLGSVYVDYGEPGVGKSTVGVDTCCHVAAGKQCRGLKTLKGPAVIVAAEDDEGVSLMLSAWENHHAPKETPQVDVIIGVTDLESECDTLISRIQETAKEYGSPVNLVMLDTLAALWRGGEDNEGYSQFLTLCRRIAKETGAAVLIIHHPGKDTSRGERGGSSLRAGVDGSFEVTEGIITIKKIRGAPAGGQWGFKLETVELGKDLDGDPITACVATPGPVARAASKLTSHQTNMVRCLQDLARANVDGTSGVRQEALRAAFIATLVGRHSNPRMVFGRTIADLQAKEWVRVKDGLISLTVDAPVGLRPTAPDLSAVVDKAKLN